MCRIINNDLASLIALHHHDTGKNSVDSFSIKALGEVIWVTANLS